MVKAEAHEGRIVLFQPLVPSYRVPFFCRLAQIFRPKFTVHASSTSMGVLTERAIIYEWERPLGRVVHVLPGLDWQCGALAVPINRADVVVVSGAPRCLSNVAVLVKAKLVGARTIWWGHYWSSTSRSWGLLTRLVLMRLSDAILFYTDREVDEYRARVGEGRTGIVFAINNGIETTEIRALRECYDPSKRPGDLLYIGRITAKADLSTLLEALTQPACSTVTLDIIGSGELEPAMRRRCEDLGLSGRVAWHGGVTDEYKISAIANRCKAFVYPGSVGLSLIHALAYGLPAIVHNDRWQHMPEIAALEIGVNGVGFERGNPGSLAAVIAETLKDFPRLSGMSDRAIATTARSFNAEDMTLRFIEAVEAVKTGALRREFFRDGVAP